MSNQYSNSHHKRRTLYLLLAFAGGICALILLALNLANAVQADEDGSVIELFNTFLTAADEVPPNDSIASGYAVLALDQDGSTLYYRVLVNDIDNITAAHIHEAAAGSNGGVVFTLFDGTGSFEPGTPISGSLTLTPAEVATLRSGDYYVNIHTTDIASGEIRGQIGTFDHNGDYNALLLGDNEVPAVETDAAGVANLEITGSSSLLYNITVSNIMSITSAHLHKGAPDDNGGVLITLYNGAGSFDPDNPLSGSTTITAEPIVDILTGFAYVNVHTESNPSGEIRGQVGTTSVFDVDLSGDNEVPAVMTDASGSGVFALSADTETLHYRLMVKDIMSVTAAHIHQGAAGENGGVIFTLFDGTGNFDEENPISGSVPLTVGQALSLISGDFYVNVHTENNPTGELRDQIEQPDGTNIFSVTLGGEQEVPPVTTTADGTAVLHYDSLLNLAFYNLQVFDIGNVTGAHLHMGSEGENGPVIFSLIDSGETLAEDDPVGGGEMLAPENIVDLLTGFTYFNVHTSDFTNGEIRGQLAAPDSEMILYLPLIYKE